MKYLVEDLRALAEKLAGPNRKFVLVAHDWGGIIAWRVAARHPAVVDRLVVMNAPHPAAFARELWTPSQLLRSSYALFFQLPWLPELVLRAGDFALIERVLRRDPARPGAFTEEDVRRHK